MKVTTGETTLPTTRALPAREIERRSIDWVPEAIQASDEALDASI